MQIIYGILLSIGILAFVLIIGWWYAGGPSFYDFRDLLSRDTELPMRRTRTGLSVPKASAGDAAEPRHRKGD
jgi:hypothetical protein